MVAVTTSEYNQGNMKYELTARKYSKFELYGLFENIELKNITFDNVPTTEGRISMSIH